MIEFKHNIDVHPIQKMGGDHMVVAAARVSTQGQEAEDLVNMPADEQFGLINYLMKFRHGTPFEHSAMTFFVNAPIFVWREWHRHRIGFCIDGETKIWTQSYAANSGLTVRKQSIKELYNNWHNGVIDSIGRVRYLASVKAQKLRCLNEETKLFEAASALDILSTGQKEGFLLETDHAKHNNLIASKDHRILTVDGWATISDLRGGELIYVNGKRSAHVGEPKMPPALRAGIGVWTSMMRRDLIKKVDRCYICNDQFNAEELVLDHVIPVVSDLTKALDVRNLQPCCVNCHQRKSDSEQKFATRDIRAGAVLSRVARKPIAVGPRDMYDVVMPDPWHNFVANGIVVHNSYNEESARYTQLKPVFYIPHREREMMKVDGWKPGRPKFVRCEDKSVYTQLYFNLAHSYTASYEAYQRNLALGIDPGLARDCLPVGIYSSCWVTCNPRSLMSFLSLRIHNEDAKYVSYPLYEIEMAAKTCEKMFEQGWPLTYKAFIENGRVGP